MKRIKLTALQEKNLKEAVSGVVVLQNQMKTLQTQLNSAANYRRGILDMICESHSLDPELLKQSTVDLKDGYLVITPSKASDRIRQAVRPQSKKEKHHGKVKA